MTLPPSIFSASSCRHSRVLCRFLLGTSVKNIPLKPPGKKGLPSPGLKGLRLFLRRKLGLDLQAWIGGLLNGQPPDTWAQNARLRSCRALRDCRYDSWGAIGDHARIFLSSLPKRCR